MPPSINIRSEAVLPIRDGAIMRYLDFYNARPLKFDNGVLRDNDGNVIASIFEEQIPIWHRWEPTIVRLEDGIPLGFKIFTDHGEKLIRLSKIEDIMSGWLEDGVITQKMADTLSTMINIMLGPSRWYWNDVFMFPCYYNYVGGEVIWSSLPIRCFIDQFPAVYYEDLTDPGLDDEFTLGSMDTWSVSDMESLEDADLTPEDCDWFAI